MHCRAIDQKELAERFRAEALELREEGGRLLAAADRLDDVANELDPATRSRRLLRERLQTLVTEAVQAISSEDDTDPDTSPELPD